MEFKTTFSQSFLQKLWFIYSQRIHKFSYISHQTSISNQMTLSAIDQRFLVIMKRILKS